MRKAAHMSGTALHHLLQSTEKGGGGCVVLVGICASVQHLLKSTAQCGCDGGCWMLVGI